MSDQNIFVHTIIYDENTRSSVSSGHIVLDNSAGIPELLEAPAADDDNYLHLCDCSNFETLTQKISEPPPRKIREIIENAKSVMLADQLRGLL